MSDPMPRHRPLAATIAAIAAAGLDPERVVTVVDMALDEDLGTTGDVTSRATIDAQQIGRAEFVARRPGVVAGMAVARLVLEVVCGEIDVAESVVDGDRLVPGSVIATVAAPVRSLLTAERTALNVLGHLSGIATLTRRWVDAVAGTGVVVRDTRKTTPGWRQLEKYAVRCGGGVNHRIGLFDGALVKDNHIAAAGGIAAAVERIRGLDRSLPIEIEVDDLDQLSVALGADVDEILLDNFTVDEMRLAVARRDQMAPTIRLEASGGLTLETAVAVASTGVDYIAVGELTHSAPVLDIGLDIVTEAERH